MEIGISRRYSGIKAITNNSQGKRTFCTLTDRALALNIFIVIVVIIITTACKKISHN